MTASYYMFLRKIIKKRVTLRMHYGHFYNKHLLSKKPRTLSAYKPYSLINCGLLAASLRGQSLFNGCCEF